MKKKTCYSCHETKPISQMEDMGVWVCKKCLEKNNKKKKKVTDSIINGGNN